jgi:hypothetical protein
MSSEPMAVEAPSLTSAPGDQAHVPHQPVDSSSNSGGNANGRKRPASPTGKESAVSGSTARRGMRRAGIMERSKELIRPFGLFPFDASISSSFSCRNLHLYGPRRLNVPNPVHPRQSRVASEETWSSAATRTRTTMALLGRTGMEMGAEMCT